MASDIYEEEGPISTSTKDIQRKWKNPPSRNDLYNDYASAESGMADYRARLSTYNQTLEGGKKIKAGTGKSTARPLVARMQAEWKYSALSEPILSARNMFKIMPVGGEDRDAAKQNGLILNNQWATKIDKVKLVDDIVRSLADEGTAIVKTGWNAEEGVKTVETEVPVYADPEESLQLMQEAIQSGQMSPEQGQAMLEMGEPFQKGTKIEYVEEETLVANHPTYEVCINANVTIDPTCNGNISKAKFVIHEYSVSYAELLEDEYTETEEGAVGYYHNLDMITADSDDEYDEFRSDDANNFRFTDKARKQLKAYEYWGDWDIQGNGELVAIVATWVGGTLIRLEENPYPHTRIPFSICTYMPVKRDIHGEPDAALLKENQEAIGNMSRAIHDSTARVAAGQEFIDENFFPSPSQKTQYEKGNTVYYRSGFDPKRAVHRSEVQNIGSAPFEVIKWQEQKASEITGTRAFAGAGAKLGTDTKSKDSMDATAKRELSILRRISSMLVDMARMTIAMNQSFLSDEETIRITGDEFVTIARDDLEGNFDLSVEVSTPEKNDEQAGKIMKLMQTNAASAAPEITNIHYVKMAELWGLPDLADQVRDYKPQPDPAQIAMQELRLEEQKLKNAILMKQLEAEDAKIDERLGRGKDDDAKRDLTNAKAEQALAVKDKLESETDILDASFLMIQSGEQRQQDIEDQEYKAQVDAASDQRKHESQSGMEYLKGAMQHTPGKVINSI